MTRIMVATALLLLLACSPPEEREELPFDSATVPTAADQEALATWTVHLDDPSERGDVQLTLSEEGFTARSTCWTSGCTSFWTVRSSRRGPPRT